MQQQPVRGTGVVAGYAYAPVAWTRPAPVPPPSAGLVAEDQREAEVARFKAAVETVAGRFADRASAATGVVSLESVNFPGYYLRHTNFDFALAPNDGTSATATA